MPDQEYLKKCGWTLIMAPAVSLALCALTLFVGVLPLLHLAAPGHEVDYSSMLTASLLAVGILCFLGSRLYCRRILKARYLQQPLTGIEHWLQTTTFRLALRRGLQPPQIAIYPSREFNAFAIGSSWQGAVIVLSEGLVHGLKPEELEAVLAHEISHIANGDVQTLSMLQAVPGLFIELPARSIDRFVAVCLPGYREGGNVYLACFVLLQLAGGWLTSLLVMYYSRLCEYRADRQATSLVGKNRMISALRCLEVMTATARSQQLPAFGISDRLKSRCIQLFNSHPSLPERLQALRTA